MQAADPYAYRVGEFDPVLAAPATRAPAHLRPRLQAATIDASNHALAAS